ncbi:kelch-like protein 24 [Branchiostoma floridae]|uniref:Kelch-like protein 24 n=1 Tax=Branchiostoma floridae TaxID=7739 RepID=A0A9J7MHE0_BRAFL|nr:kelch-like protein 24 [Branchiostoma floridae]XP_035667671.1 kelch-like protein 24 [Branchiostoma floridae]
MGEERKWHGMAALNGQAYVVGGDVEGTWRLEDVEVYRETTNSWENVAPLKLGVSQFAIATFSGNMYVFGGERRSTTTTTRRTGCVQRYNPAEDEWTFATPLPDKPWPGKAFTIKANVYLFGGEMDGILCYDPLTDCYEKVHESDRWVLSGHDEFSSTVCGSEIYIVGGRRTKVYPGTKPKPTVRCCNVTSGIVSTWGLTELPLPLYMHNVVTVLKN